MRTSYFSAQFLQLDPSLSLPMEMDVIGIISSVQLSSAQKAFTTLDTCEPEPVLAVLPHLVLLSLWQPDLYPSLISELILRSAREQADTLYITQIGAI